MAAGVEESPRKLVAKDAYLILPGPSPILIVFAVLGKIWLGFGAWMCTGLVLLVVRVRWDLRKHAWFWATIIFAELLQMPLVVLLPWNDRSFTWIIFLPVAALDYGLVYVCVKWIEKLRGGKAFELPDSQIRANHRPLFSLRLIPLGVPDHRHEVAPARAEAVSGLCPDWQRPRNDPVTCSRNSPASHRSGQSANVAFASKRE